MIRRLLSLSFAVALCVLSSACNRRTAVVVGGDPRWEPLLQLSAYGLFEGNGATQTPVAAAVPYDLNTPLFSDYAVKHRFVRLPSGESARYDEDGVFEFPVGTIIAKTFAYPHDMRDQSKGERLIETRLLIHRPEGWTGYPYIWNDEQTDATLKVVGGVRPVRWIHKDGSERTNQYRIPDVNQCMSCHENNKRMSPIGLRARHLNKDFNYPSGHENQLTHWSKRGILKGAPVAEQAPRAAVWNDPATGTLDQRARIWLEINCAHCHNPNGPARTSGLDLMASQPDRYKWGVFKGPVAAGQGTGGRSYDVVPGKPDESILVYRLESTTTGIMMPELSRRLVDTEGVAIIREWVASLGE